MKKIFFSIYVIILSGSIFLPAFPSLLEYKKPIPFGGETELIEGLDTEEQGKAIDDYYRYSSREWEQQLLNIDYNFRQKIDEEKYYSGACLKSDSEDMRHLYIFITDITIVPEELKKFDKVHFQEVKYSYEELSKFRDIICEKFIHTLLLYGAGIDVEQNKVDLQLDYELDISLISEYIPSDSFIYELYHECPNIGAADIIADDVDNH